MFESKTISFATVAIVVGTIGWGLSQQLGWDFEALKIILTWAVGAVGVRGVSEHIGRGMKR